ncbi:unnamed protein product [Acanthoscelides obtectus]|uniref:Homeotic protein ultrabithorax n=1 Tax=Acanthoscelides obtectus TaxID=200917 RepID=A0A9P0JRK9_ACAOB|nr:unnamed protein product [Acanthoscelides obtectus]CAK1654324.1 Homeotic protein ultrabithorax [Acanthoscelides obtectus]
MNSYFEQSGFYGGHHHQSASSVTGAHHHDHQSAAAAAAYRSFPLSLGMSPYASTQHHHAHSLHQARPPQDSPYDASVAAAACKLYSSSTDSQQNSVNYSSSNTKSDCSKGNADQNGYASVVAAAAVKDVWQSAASGGGANLSNSLTGPVRPAACTPDSRVGYGSSVGLVGGDPSSSPGTASGGRTGNSLSSWNNPCSLNTTSSQPVGTQIHQQTNHTFYPWMAIAGAVQDTFATGALTQHLGVSRPDSCLDSHFSTTNISALLTLLNESPAKRKVLAAIRMSVLQAQSNQASRRRRDERPPWLRIAHNLHSSPEYYAIKAG